MTTKYSLTKSDLSGLKGIISETLIRQYVGQVIIPKLKEEWDFVIGGYPSTTRLISMGLFPNINLRNKMEKLKEILKHSPDGYITKMRKTKERIGLKDALNELGLSSFLHGSWRYGSEDIFVGSEHNENEQLPVVDGEIEIIEVKSDKARLHSVQREDYRKAILDGFSIRYFHVKIISFDKNKFEIVEKLIQDISSLIGADS